MNNINRPYVKCEKDVVTHESYWNVCVASKDGKTINILKKFTDKFHGEADAYKYARNNQNLSV